MSFIDNIKKELKEWNIVLKAKRPGDIAHEIIKEFNMESFKDD